MDDQMDEQDEQDEQMKAAITDLNNRVVAAVAGFAETTTLDHAEFYSALTFALAHQVANAIVAFSYEPDDGKRAANFVALLQKMVGNIRDHKAED